MNCLRQVEHTCGNLWHRYFAIQFAMRVFTHLTHVHILISLSIIIWYKPWMADIFASYSVFFDSSFATVLCRDCIVSSRLRNLEATTSGSFNNNLLSISSAFVSDTITQNNRILNIINYHLTIYCKYVCHLISNQNVKDKIRIFCVLVRIYRDVQSIKKDTS